MKVEATSPLGRLTRLDTDGELSRHGRASKHAYDEIRRAILSGELPVGTVLAEETVAESLGMSRTPVRQALRLLHQGELVETGPRRQLVVRRVSPEQRRQIFLVREALERVAVTQACNVMSLEDIDRLRLILFQQKRAADVGRTGQFIDLDEQFHLMIASTAKIPLLSSFLSQLRAFVRLMGIEALGRPGRMSQVMCEHHAILEALERRDARAALAALSEHLRATEEVLADTPKHRGLSNQ